MSLQSLLGKSINIETYTVTLVHGARTKQWSPLYTGLPARIQPLSAKDGARFMRDGMEVTHKVYVGSTGMGLVNNLAITQKERLKFGTGNAARYFAIQGVTNPDELSRYLILWCNELKA